MPVDYLNSINIPQSPHDYFHYIFGFHTHPVSCKTCMCTSTCCFRPCSDRKTMYLMYTSHNPSPARVPHGAPPFNSPKTRPWALPLIWFGQEDITKPDVNLSLKGIGSLVLVFLDAVGPRESLGPLHGRHRGLSKGQYRHFWEEGCEVTWNQSTSVKDEVTEGSSVTPGITSIAIFQLTPAPMFTKGKWSNEMVSSNYCWFITQQRLLAQKT